MMMEEGVTLPGTAELERELAAITRRMDRLQGLAEERIAAHGSARQDMEEAEDFLEVAPRAKELLEELTTSLFGEILNDVESNLTHALREILGQERTVVSNREIKSNRLHVNLSVLSPEGEEDILVGQGGSVCNILSVGLRLIALSRLDPANHRPFLVLDEQDCWLKPELVPVFMKLIARIARALDLQVFVISHHPVDLFAMYAKRIYSLHPKKKGGPEVVLERDVVDLPEDTAIFSGHSSNSME